MSRLLAIEGADGAGKGTTAAEVVRQLGQRGDRVQLISFPRYRATASGAMIGQFLAGELPHAMAPASVAVLYALDRFESREAILHVMAQSDVLVFDRYIASNAAYQAAKVDDAEAAALMQWIVALETGPFALPLPSLSIYLDTPLATARAQIAQKHRRDYTDRTYDEHEADGALQANVRRRYAELAGGDLLGRWHTVAPVRDGMRPPADIAAEIIAALDAG